MSRRSPACNILSQPRLCILCNLDHVSQPVESIGPTGPQPWRDVHTLSARGGPGSRANPRMTEQSGDEGESSSHAISTASAKFF
jgi:hypothetical protein